MWPRSAFQRSDLPRSQVPRPYYRVSTFVKLRYLLERVLASDLVLPRIEVLGKNTALDL